MTERLTVISGPMFSGKTTEIHQIISRQRLRRKFVHSFKPAIDVRWEKESFTCTHEGLSVPSMPVKNSLEILEKLDPRARVVVIDEVQFFDDYIVPVIDELIQRDIQVIVAGLPENFRGEPFGQMPVLLSKADEIVQLFSDCQHVEENGEYCGIPATKTQRIVEGKPAKYTDPVILIGAKESYEARCYKHHEVPGKPESIILFQRKTPDPYTIATDQSISLITKEGTETK